MAASYELSGTSDGIRVENVISGREGAGSLQRLLCGGQSLNLLRSVLSRMLLAPGSLGDCRLTRANSVRATN